GYITAYDTETGNQAWRWFTVPGDPAKPFEDDSMAAAAKTWDPAGKYWLNGGGGTPWDSITYDPDLNLIYVGTGNGSPWNRNVRSPSGGDNLYLASIVALNADTGKYVWHYQETPGDHWDYTSAQPMTLADLNIERASRQVILSAPAKTYSQTPQTPGKFGGATGWNVGFMLNAAEPKAPAFGRLLAWDPVKQKEAWRAEYVAPWNGGTLTTAGNLVFQGTADGRFI